MKNCLVYGYCFSEDEYYSINGTEIDGWDLIYHLLPDNIKTHRAKLELIRYGNTYLGTKGGMCLAIKILDKGHSYMVEIPDEFIKETKEISTNEYWNVLKSVGLDHLNRFKPTVMALCSC